LFYIAVLAVSLASYAFLSGRLANPLMVQIKTKNLV